MKHSPKSEIVRENVVGKPKQHGGHITGFRGDTSTGYGPVYEIRRALGLSQAEMAYKIGCCRDTIQRCERDGVLPHSRASQSLLYALAPPLDERQGRMLMKKLN
jgi:DNA-binding XRE family transcriptional regulator